MQAFKQRRQILHQELKENSLLILFAGSALKRSADSDYPFVVNRNFYYLLNCDEDELIYCAYKKGEHVLETLFVKDFNPLLEKWVGKSLTKEEASKRSGVQSVLVLSQFESYINRLFARSLVSAVYVDYERINLKHIPSAGETYALKIKELFPSLPLSNVNATLNAMRSKKSEEEVERIQKAIHTTHLGFNRVLSKLKPGRYEYEVAADFHYQLSLENSYPSFSTIVASAEDATILHYVTNQKQLKDNTLLLMDCGATYEHYCADITRTFPVNGKFNERQKVYYQIVLDALYKVIEAIKPGMTLAQLNEIVKNHYRTACVDAKIIKDKSEVDEVYYHGVSHYLGLDTHDVGSYEGAVLEAGMIITVEPGLYSAQEGIGVRIEDDILVTEDGAVNLSLEIPRDIDAVEEWMKSLS